MVIVCPTLLAPALVLSFHTVLVSPCRPSSSSESLKTFSAVLSFVKNTTIITTTTFTSASIDVYTATRAATTSTVPPPIPENFKLVTKGSTASGQVVQRLSIPEYRLDLGIYQETHEKSTSLSTKLPANFDSGPLGLCPLPGTSSLIIGSGGLTTKEKAGRV